MTALHATDTPPAPKPVQPAVAPAAASPARDKEAAAADNQEKAAVRPAVRTVTAPPVAQRANLRIDAKRPYMRVWYWPPMPLEEAGPNIYSQDSGQGGTAHGAPDPRGNKLDDVNFPVNRAKVVDEESQLEHLANWMKANPAIEVALDGYADARGSQAHNRKLAASRAEAVKAFLVARGVSAGRVTAQGHGTSNPVKGETTEESYWLSRRVVIRFKGAPAISRRPEAAPAAVEAPKASAVEPAPSPSAGTDEEEN